MVLEKVVVMASEMVALEKVVALALVLVLAWVAAQARRVVPVDSDDRAEQVLMELQAAIQLATLKA